MKMWYYEILLNSLCLDLSYVIIALDQHWSRWHKAFNWNPILTLSQWGSYHKIKGYLKFHFFYHKIASENCHPICLGLHV